MRINLIKWYEFLKIICLGKDFFEGGMGGQILNALEIYQWLQRLYSGLMDGAKSRQES